MKIIRFIRNEGFIDTFKLIYENLAGILGLKERKTIFYRIDINKLESFDMPDENYSLRLIRDFNEIKGLNIIGRRDKDYFRKKFEQGSICAVNIDNDNIVAYSWIHFNEHRLDRELKLVFDERTVWWGPLFIHKPYRGQKISPMHLHYLADNLKKVNFKYMFTSTNPNNYPAISLLLNNNWRIVGLLVLRKFFNRKISINKFEFHPDNLLAKHLKII